VIASIKEQIIVPAEAKVRELRQAIKDLAARAARWCPQNKGLPTVYSYNAGNPGAIDPPCHLVQCALFIFFLKGSKAPSQSSLWLKCF
jgi:hypothetical protein